MGLLPVCLILDNIRGLYNVGSIFRIADGAGVEKIYLTGITGYPGTETDVRKPWEIKSVTQKIRKTALGAEKSVNWEYVKDAIKLVDQLHKDRFQIVALEKTEQSKSIYEAEFKFPMALIVGHEIEGVSPTLLQKVDQIISIPMFGSKESLNVATATAIAVYELLRRTHLKSLK